MARKPSEKERFEVLLEDLKTEFRSVTERVVALDEKISRGVEELRADLGQRITLLEVAVKEHSQRIGGLEVAVKEHSQRIGGLEAAVTELSRDMKALKQQVELHEQAHARG